MDYSRFPIFKRLLLSILVIFLICSSIQPVYAITLYDNPSAWKNGTSLLEDPANVLQQPEDSAIIQAQSIQESINVMQNAIDQDNQVI